MKPFEKAFEDYLNNPFRGYIRRKKVKRSYQLINIFGTGRLVNRSNLAFGLLLEGTLAVALITFVATDVFYGHGYLNSLFDTISGGGIFMVFLALLIGFLLIFSLLDFAMYIFYLMRNVKWG